MTETLYAKHAGEWKTVDRVETNDGGSWELADELRHRQGNGTLLRSWYRNDPPGPVTGLDLTNSGTSASTASWVLPADVQSDHAAVEIRWQVNGVWGSWQTLAASATSHTRTGLDQGSELRVNVRVLDTAGTYGSSRYSSTKHLLMSAVSASIDDTGLDRVTVNYGTAPDPAQSIRIRNQDVGGATTWQSFTESRYAGSRDLVIPPDTSRDIVVDVLGPDGRYSAPTTITGTTDSGIAAPPFLDWYASGSGLGGKNYTTPWVRWANYGGGAAEHTTQIEVSTSSDFSSNVQRSTLPQGSVSTSSTTFSVSQGVRYYFRLRYRGPNGFWGVWSPTASVTNGVNPVTSTSPWESSNLVFDLYEGEAAGIAIPSDVTPSSLDVFNAVATGYSTTEAGNREVRYWTPEQQYAAPNEATPWSTNVAVGETVGPVGLAIVGSGWSARGVSTAHRLQGTLKLYGQQTSTSTGSAHTVHA